MPAAHTLLAFAAATVAILLIPGPAVMYTVNRSVCDGRRVGLAAVAGLELGDAIQAAAAAFGLSAVIATSAAAFTVVKWAGAVYLVAIGVRALRRAPEALSADRGSVSTARAFRQGILVNALNPKTAMFFLSIFPQFIDTHRGTVTQSLVLGALFVTLATIFNGTYSLIASHLREVLLRGRGLAFVRRYVSGSAFIGLGLLAARANPA